MNSNFLPNLHPNFSYRVDSVGNEKQPVLLVDNFLESPEFMVDIAKKYVQFQGSRRLYPGVESQVPNFYGEAISTYLGDIICKVFAMNSANRMRSNSSFAMVLTPPEQLHPDQCKPHIDSTDALQLASVLFLCAPDKGGTSLYRHRATGFESVDENRLSTIYPYLEKERSEGDWIGHYINGSNQHYEQIASYDAVFNRLIIYRGTSLHSGNIASNFNFDPNPATGRLTITSFIEFRD